MRVAVTGATGYLGGFVLEELLACGSEMRAWARTPQPARPGVVWIPGALDDPGSMQALVEGADALVHLAYQHLPERYRDGEGDDLEGYLRTNLFGSLRLLEIARLAGVERSVVLSSRAVYPRGIVGRRLTEVEPARPNSHYGAYKAALEAFVPSFQAKHGWHIAALRPTGIYGLVSPLPRTKWFDLVKNVLQGRAITRIRGGTEVHGADVARAIWLLLSDDRAAGGIYNCSDLYVTSREVAEIVQRVSGVSGPLPPEPEAPPSSVMDTTRLEALGWRPGGRPLLEQTIDQLVDAIQPLPAP